MIQREKCFIALYTTLQLFIYIQIYFILRSHEHTESIAFPFFFIAQVMQTEHIKTKSLVSLLLTINLC